MAAISIELENMFCADVVSDWKISDATGGNWASESPAEGTFQSLGSITKQQAVPIKCANKCPHSTFTRIESSLVHF